MGVRSLLLFGIKLLDLSDREFCDSGDRSNGEVRSLVSTPLRSLLALIVEPGCQVIDPKFNKASPRASSCSIDSFPMRSTTGSVADPTFRLNRRRTFDRPPSSAWNLLVWAIALSHGSNRLDASPYLASA
jgi:hypothetical protein